MTIIGIDPGTATTGYGILKFQKTKAGQKFQVVDYGCIFTDKKLPSQERLKKLYRELKKLITRYKPQIMGVENVYFFKNLKTAMPVSQAKGVILLAAAEKKIPIFEFSPLQVKMAIAGYGKAEKKQIRGMLKLILELDKFPKIYSGKFLDDASDALGIAVCCGLYLKINKGKKSKILTS